MIFGRPDLVAVWVICACVQENNRRSIVFLLKKLVTHLK